MALRGVMSAPPRKPVFLVWGKYVQISGARSHPRGRIWLLADNEETEAPIRALIAWNNPTTGRAEYEDLGEIVHANIRSKSAEITLSGSRVITTIEHPCVCGAGAVGNAGPSDPEEGPITLTYVNPYHRQRIVLA